MSLESRLKWALKELDKYGDDSLYESVESRLDKVLDAYIHDLKMAFGNLNMDKMKVAKELSKWK